MIIQNLTFECPTCGARITVVGADRRKTVECQHVPERQLNEKPPTEMRVVD